MLQIQCVFYLISSHYSATGSISNLSHASKTHQYYDKSYSPTIYMPSNIFDWKSHVFWEDFSENIIFSTIECQVTFKRTFPSIILAYELQFVLILFSYHRSNWLKGSESLQQNNNLNWWIPSNWIRHDIAGKMQTFQIDTGYKIGFCIQKIKFNLFIYFS